MLCWGRGDCPGGVHGGGVWEDRSGGRWTGVRYRVGKHNSALLTGDIFLVRYTGLVLHSLGGNPVHTTRGPLVCEGAEGGEGNLQRVSTPGELLPC